jgi:hypothetical protein
MGGVAPMTRAEPVQLDPEAAASRIADWGFLANPDLPDRPGPAFLLVALRPSPTLRHYDPEIAEYWVTVDGRGERRTLNRQTVMPLSTEFSWGMIRLVDRLHVSNEYLTFGGRLDAASIDEATIGVFTSPVPLLRRGGHSQPWDEGADMVGAFFGRLMVAVDYAPGFESAMANAEPTVRYAAFVRHVLDRRHGGSSMDGGSFQLLIRREANRLRDSAPADWGAGGLLLDASIQV